MANVQIRHVEPVAPQMIKAPVVSSMTLFTSTGVLCACSRWVIACSNSRALRT